MAVPPTPERFAEPIRGWRIWNLSEDPERGTLLHPVGSGSGAWEPRRAVRARCTPPPFVGLTRRSHEAPDPACTCGIYAARSLEVFDRPRPAYPPPPVVGTVSMWGRVIEHERGWRAAEAYPAQLRLVCAMCAWFEPGPGTPAVVHGFAGQLYTLCDVHRGGIQLPDGRRSAPTDLDPGGLQARVLDAYAVELVPWERVEVLFRFPRTPDPPPYKPTIRVVPAG
ncbi:MAG TPA: hypothetical protein VF984_12505 [Actinomycetota bacterium]